MRDNAIDWTTTTLKTLSNVSPIPPLTVATNVVLSIIQIVSFQDIKTNQQGCLSLAQRATELLTFLQKRMEGKGDAPQSLLEDIREFEETLRSIHKFVCQLMQMSLIRRGFEKSSIQDQLIRHEQKLEGARWRFQLSLSIETRYSLGAPGGATSSSLPRPVDQGVIANSMECPTALSSLAGHPPKCSISGLEVVNQFHGHDKSPSSATLMPTEEGEFLASMVEDTDEFGFRRYHQSDVIIRKLNRKAIGWFAGSSDADVCGQKMTIKRYDGEEDLALKKWVRDIKALRNLHHENLPQMLGYSHRRAPTPFILLAGVQNRALDSVMQSVLTTRSLADCASLILSTYRDIASAVAYAQQQLSLSQVDSQYFIQQATYSVDSNHTVIVGLPPPRVKGNALYLRSLEASVVHCVTRTLEELVDVESSALRVGPRKKAITFNKLEWLRGLLHFLFPRRREGLDLSPELEDLLDSVDEDKPLTLPALRAVSMHQSRSIQWSYPESLVGPFKPGDYGYTTGDPRDLSNFVFLGNIQDGECVKEVKHVVCEANCTMFMLEHDPVICHRSGLPAGASLVLDEGECWEVPLPAGDAYVRVCHKTGLASAKAAWEFLVANGASLASRHGVEPQALILVTRYERNDDYDATGWLSSLGIRRAIEFGFTIPDGLVFPVPERRAEAPLDTPIVYLITSFKPDFATYITDESMSVFPEHSTGSAPLVLGPRCPGSSYEVIDYIRLDAENLE